MRYIQTRSVRAFFRILAGTSRSQAAMMVLDPGQSTGGADNVHPRSDQWLFVVSGSGTASVAGRTVALGAGALLLIEAGEAHEIVNTARRPLVTVNVYAPSAY